MNLNNLSNQIRLESEVIAIAIAVLVIVVVSLVNRKRLLVRFREWRIQRNLDQIGCEQIRELVCSDGLEGHYNIDRLALLQNAILLISYKPYGGNIYCAERIAEWTQVVGQKSFKFENPIFELENQLTALKLLTGTTQLKGYLFFNYNAEFPKGHPDMVLHPEKLPENFLNVDPATVKAEIRAAWELAKAHQQQVSTPDQVGVKT